MGRHDSYKEIELGQLRSFCLAASKGSFSAAAQALDLSVTSIWEQVRALERKLGATLLHRRGRALELTEQGRLLLELIQPHVSGLDSLERLFQDRSAALPVQLQVTATPYLMTHWLPEPVREFTAKHPTVRLKLMTDPDAAVVARMVESGKADLGVLTMDWEATTSALLAYEPLFEMRLMLVTSSDHPLAKKRQIRPAHLVCYPLITLREGSPPWQALDRILFLHGLRERAHILMESSTYHQVFKHVSLGLGVSLIHLPLADKRLWPGLHLREFPSDLPSLPVATVVRKHAHLAAPVQEFQALVRRRLAGNR